MVYCKRTGDGRSETVKKEFNNYYRSRNEHILEENQLRINFFNRVGLIDRLHYVFGREISTIMSML